MRSHVRTIAALLGSAFALAAGTCVTPGFQVTGGPPAGWEHVLSALGFQPAQSDPMIEVVRGPGAAGNAAYLILEGDSTAARDLGFAPSGRVRVQSVVDSHRPSLDIVWEEAKELPVFEIPAGATIFARDKWSNAPLMAGFRRGNGAVLWVATAPGGHGYERFPYILHALCDLGLQAPFQSRHLWAFFDSSYRRRVDLDYLAARWRKAGIAALHVAAWHYFEPGAEGDSYLRRLIEACHKKGILVYAWLELPHVSEKFWDDHPEWREQTAVLQDARLDWRKLMNLANPSCFQAVSKGVRELLLRFDWDGVNLAELYFESLEGAANPARFTPMNADVRRQFNKAAGFDPLDLFNPASPVFHGRNGQPLRKFLDFRAGLAADLQARWVREIESLRPSKPDLDFVLTHVDDRFDTSMRDALGADAARALQLLDKHNLTFLIEDPATVWHLGPQRYPEIAHRYSRLTTRTDRLAIDINVVERYQDVYPTKQQTGTELLQLIRLASSAFHRVALYFENSILAPDLPLLSPAAAVGSAACAADGGYAVSSPRGLGVPWRGPVAVDGKIWPVADGEVAWLPPGKHVLSASHTAPDARVLDFNGGLEAAAALPGGVELAYRGSASALAILSRRPVKIEIDGVERNCPVLADSGRYTVALPRGQHIVSFGF